MKELTGMGVALITPFNEDGSIDFASLEKIVEFNIQEGTNYFVVLGTTAEVATLNLDEKKKVIECIKKVNSSRLPLVLGIGGNNTANIVTEIKSTDLTDFCAILSVSPYYNKPTQEGIYQHYKALSDNTIKPIILYNVPGRTGSNILASTTVRIAKNCKNIIAIKEAGEFLQSLDIIKDKQESFVVTSGNDETALAMTLAGGNGVISVIGQAIPKVYSNMIKLGLERKVDEAYKINYATANLVKYIFEEGNPAGVKALMSLKGLCKPYTRLPLVAASEQLIEKIKKELIKLEN